MLNNFSDGLHVIISWVEAGHDTQKLPASLSSLVDLLRAERGVLLRLELDTAQQSTIAEMRAGSAAAPDPGRGISFSQYLLCHGVGKARAGSVWHLSDLAGELLPEADRPKTRISFGGERTRESSAIVLEPGGRESDILELHFARLLSKKEMGDLSMVGALLSRIWQHRRVLRGVDALGRDTDAASVSGLPILSAVNPAGLSRAEYRVCSLLSRGMSVKAISGSLRVSESTVRSHLRSIYAKTKTHGQRELICRLLGPGGPHVDIEAAGPPALPSLMDRARPRPDAARSGAVRSR